MKAKPKPKTAKTEASNAHVTEAVVTEEPAVYAAEAAKQEQSKPNVQKGVQEIDGWIPFWMIVVAGKRGPKCKYHSLAAAMRDANDLCTINSRKTFILSPIGVILPPGSTDLPENKPNKSVDNP